jgi:hypothetical protein
MRTAARRVLVALVSALALAASPAAAQVCTGVDYFDRCLDAIGGRPADGSGARDPTRIVDDIFQTSDTPPRFGPQLTFGRLIPERSVVNAPNCTGGVSSSVVDPARFPAADPRSYTAYTCVEGLTAAEAALYGDHLDWRWLQNVRVRSDGNNAADVDDCGGDLALCGYTAPWRSGFLFDLQGAANRVVIFPVTDHVANSCLEAFEYSVYLTDDPASTGFVGDGEAPDPRRWNRAVLVRGFLRGWTNNPLSTGTVEDMAAHPLTEGRDAPGQEAISDSIATVWSLPCGVEFRYAAVVPGNYGNPDSRCTFHSNEDEFDAVAGLNEDNTAVCVDADRDGFRSAACGGPDCDDADPAVNPGAVESCASARDLNCDGATPQCPTATACVGGLCVPRCVEGSCSDGFVCVRVDGGADYCVPTPCADVTCPAGQVCGPRGCQDPCAGAVCPVGQVCRGGACVDPCAGLVCPSRQHCDDGRCVPNCPCVPCAAGTVCDAASGRCASPGCSDLRCVPGTLPDCSGTSPRCVMACAGVTCPLGTRCDDGVGRCVVDRCAGVACPTGSACVDGMCARLAPPDAGLRDAGAPGPDAGVAMDVPRPATDAGARPMDAGADAGELLVDAPDPACACRAGSGRARGAPLAAMAALAVMAARRRRRYGAAASR